MEWKPSPKRYKINNIIDARVCIKASLIPSPPSKVHAVTGRQKISDKDWIGRSGGKGGGVAILSPSFISQSERQRCVANVQA